MGKYIMNFETHSQYEEYMGGGDVALPNVSYCKDNDEVHYNPYVHDYSQDYLTFITLTDGTYRFSGSTTANTLSYSIDDGETWTQLGRNANTPTITSGTKVLWKGKLSPKSDKGIGGFSSTAQFDLEGNPMSLLYGDDFKGQTSLEGKDYAFYKLFSGCTNLVSVEKLILLATTLANYCYYGMFYGCTSLTTATELPATTLANWCYGWMFLGCTSLTTAPELPATTLAQYCYRCMFQGCTSLTTAPELLVTTLADWCYCSMFYGCTSLTTAPSLPATTLASSCYYSMFQGCTSLTEAPELPATTLVSGCYYSMFQGCTNLNYIKAMFTTTPNASYTQSWVSGVASSGTFVKNSAATWNVTGVNGIPTNWTVETAAA